MKSIFRSMFFLPYRDPSSYSGKNDQALRNVIQQKHLPGSKEARRDVRRMSKGKKGRR